MLFPERVNFSEALDACARQLVRAAAGGWRKRDARNTALPSSPLRRGRLTPPLCAACSAPAPQPGGTLANLDSREALAAVGNALLPTLSMQYSLQLAWVGARGVADQTHTAAIIAGDSSLVPPDADGHHSPAQLFAEGGPRWLTTGTLVNASLYTHPGERYLQWRGSDASFSRYSPQVRGRRRRGSARRSGARRSCAASAADARAAAALLPPPCARPPQTARQAGVRGGAGCVAAVRSLVLQHALGAARRQHHAPGAVRVHLRAPDGLHMPM